MLATRDLGALTHPALWGDEGWLFYPQAYESGLRSLLWPDNGYLNTAQRLGALSAVYLRLPLVWVPTVFSAIALGTQLLTALFLASSRIAPLWPHARQRGAFALLYLALPNSFETLGTLTNIQWHLALLAYMVVIAPPPRRAWCGLFDAGVLVVGGLSGPFAILLAPFAAYRTWTFRRDPPARRVSVWRLAIVVACACVQGCFILSVSRHFPAPLGAGFIPLARIVATRVVLSFLLSVHVVSQLVHTRVWRQDTLPVLVTVTAVLATGVALLRGGAALRMFLLFVAVVFASELASPAVSLTAPQWEVMSVPTGGAGQRYFLMPMLGWAAVLFALAGGPSGRWRQAARVCLAVTALLAVPADWLYPRGRATGFVALARAFNAAPPGARFEFPVLPAGTMVLIKQ